MVTAPGGLIPAVESVCSRPAFLIRTVPFFTSIFTTSIIPSFPPSLRMRERAAAAGWPTALASVTRSKTSFLPNVAMMPVISTWAPACALVPCASEAAGTISAARVKLATTILVRVFMVLRVASDFVATASAGSALYLILRWLAGVTCIPESTFFHERRPPT